MHPVCCIYLEMSLELDWNPLVANSADWTLFRKAHTCMYKVPQFILHCHRTSSRELWPFGVLVLGNHQELWWWETPWILSQISSCRWSQGWDGQARGYRVGKLVASLATHKTGRAVLDQGLNVPVYPWPTHLVSAALFSSQYPSGPHAPWSKHVHAEC